MSGTPGREQGRDQPHAITLAATSRLGPQWTIHSGILNSGDTTPRHPEGRQRVDDPEMGEHRHHMPHWGRILWRRQWEQAAQVDRLSSLIHHMKESLVAAQSDIDALTAELGTALTNIQAEIAALQAANPALDLSGLQTAADALLALAPTPAPADVPPTV